MDTNTETLHPDLLVIGFGKGGKTLAAKIGREGKHVIMIEQSDHMYGGTCINIGCVPTKALIHRAEHRREGHQPQEWYQNAVGSAQKLTTLMREKNFQMLDVVDTITVITGRASFIDTKTVEVTAGEDRLTISADTIVINTGAEPFMPDIPGLHTSKYVYTSTEMISTTELPRMYSHFGSEVTVLEAAPRIMPNEDDDIVTSALDILHDQGVTLTAGARVTEVRDGEGAAVLSYEKDGQNHTVEADAVLMALGRVPATRGLGLDKAGVVTNARGAIEVDEYLHTSQRHIFAIGDVNGGPQFTYISLDDHRIVTDQLTGSGLLSTADRTAGDISTVPYTVFMTPALSRVGLTERQARESGRQVKIATKPIAQIAAMPRAKIVEETRGMMKFVVDADTDQILGAALLSVDSQELINLIALAIKYGVTASELRDGIYTHPSSTEAFNEVLSSLSY
jgi:pyruvate/2-oxoglutarate dehydrogenase complex dihydrolipoamide dehydrogenase (E3) component